MENFCEDSSVEHQFRWDLMSKFWNIAMWGREGGKNWVPRTQQGSGTKTEAHKESEERNLNAEEGGGKQHVEWAARAYIYMETTGHLRALHEEVHSE